MKRTASLGAAIGSALGLVVSVLLGLLILGVDEVSGVIDADQLPVLYVMLAVLGAIVGAVVGALVAFVAVRVATAASGDATARRRKGALAAAAISSVLSVLLSPVGRLAVVAIVAGAVLGGAIAWFMIPRLVDLHADRPPRPVVDSYSPASRPGKSATRRFVFTGAAAAIGGLLGANVIMAALGSFLSLSRSAEETLAFVVLAVVAALIGTMVWRRMGPPAT